MAVAVVIDGRLVEDPELRYTPTGKAVAKFRIASNERRKVEGKWVEGEGTFLRCVAWGEMATNTAESLKKGDLVVVTGRLRQQSWEQEGQKRTSFEVNVDHIGPSLLFSQATVRKMQRSQSDAFVSDPWATDVL